MIQTFEPGQQKIKFYELTEINNCNNSPFFYHNKSILFNLNKK